MNKGIEILLARMDSNPDEFMGVNNKWSNLIESHEDYMTDEDRKALFAKLHELRMDKFTEHVMKKLLAEEEKPTASPFGQAGMSQAGAIQGLYTAAGQAGMYATQAQLAQQQLAMQNAAQNAYANTSTIPLNNSNAISNSIQLGKQTLTERTLKKLKALIK